MASVLGVFKAFISFSVWEVASAADDRLVFIVQPTQGVGFTVSGSGFRYQGLRVQEGKLPPRQMGVWSCLRPSFPA